MALFGSDALLKMNRELWEIVWTKIKAIKHSTSKEP